MPNSKIDGLAKTFVNNQVINYCKKEANGDPNKLTDCLSKKESIFDCQQRVGDDYQKISQCLSGKTSQMENREFYKSRQIETNNKLNEQKTPSDEELQNQIDEKIKNSFPKIS